MNRRDFLKTTAALAAQFAAVKAFGEEAQQEIKTVYVVAKCHLDLGFTDFEKDVIRKYFENYIPTAIETATRLQTTHAEERYAWTLGSWMVYEYLEQTSAENRRNMEQAIASGHIAWHAIPFTWQSEMLDRSLMESALGMTKALDRRFGVRTIAAKLSDVPGHTRGLIGPVAAAGIEFLDIGSNFHSPDIPREPHLFNWRDPEGAQLTVLYHLLNYGGTTVVPGTDTAVAINVRNDNSGPHPISEIKAYYAELHKRFPNAKIVATNLNTIAHAIRPIRDRLPVLTQEIGDTWIYGVGSDPGKVARYRELSRLRLEWLSKGAFHAGDSVDLAFTSKLILATEHNWGLDTGALPRPWGMLGNFPKVYAPDELAAARTSEPVFKTFDACWEEKRADINRAVDELPQPLRAEARERLRSLIPVAPDTRHFKTFTPNTDLVTTHFVVGLDAKTGAIRRLLDRKTGREWASGGHPLALFSYQTFTSADCLRYVQQYAMMGWPNDVWGKPGLENYPVESRIWEPVLHKTQLDETSDAHWIISELQISDGGGKVAGFLSCPKRLLMEIKLPKGKAEAQLTLQCFEKRANRLPEAMWLSFRPDAPSEYGWQLEKVEQYVSPHDVVPYGGRHLHAVTRQVRYSDQRGRFVLETLDAPLVAPGQRLLTDFNDNQPKMSEGIHINLYNNLWNTAFPQWYGEDMRFRFVISCSDAADPSNTKISVAEAVGSHESRAVPGL